MKVGSLVECIGEFERDSADIFFDILVPAKGGIYIVRTIENGRHYKDEIFIRVEEIVNPKVCVHNGELIETQFSIKKFRELQPPMDLSELLEETKMAVI